MPNNIHLPMCPFFRYEKNKSISCEDVYRRFRDSKHKYAWMDRYCDVSDWQICPWAMQLNELYDRVEKGADMEQEYAEHRIKALEKELKKVSSSLGRAEKRLTRQQKKIDEMRNVNKSLIIRNEDLDHKNRELYRKWREDAAGNKVNDLICKVTNQADKVLSMYKNVACYLLEHTGGKVYEEDVETWAEGKVYTIYREYDETGKMMWQVIAEEVPEKGDESQDEHDAGRVQEDEEGRAEEQVQEPSDSDRRDLLRFEEGSRSMA